MEKFSLNNFFAKKKRIFSIIMAISLLISVMPFSDWGAVTVRADQARKKVLIMSNNEGVHGAYPEYNFAPLVSCYSSIGVDCTADCSLDRLKDNLDEYSLIIITVGDWGKDHPISDLSLYANNINEYAKKGGCVLISFEYERPDGAGGMVGNNNLRELVNELGHNVTCGTSDFLHGLSDFVDIDPSHKLGDRSNSYGAAVGYHLVGMDSNELYTTNEDAVVVGTYTDESGVVHNMIIDIPLEKGFVTYIGDVSLITYNGGFQKNNKWFASSLLERSAESIEEATHSHNWKVEKDGEDAILLYCLETEGACDYQGIEHASRVSVTAEDKQYDGESYDGAAIVKDSDWPSRVPISGIKYFGRDGTSYDNENDAPVGVGKYIAKITCNDEEACAEFEITKANQDVQLQMESYYFGQTPSIPKVSGCQENPTITFFYEKDKARAEALEWSNISETTLDVGSYKMYAKLEATDNYNECITDKYSFDVISDEFEVTVDDVHVTYDGNGHGIVVECELADVTIQYGTSSDSCDKDESPQYSEAGEYSVYYEVSKRGYHTVYGSAKVIIDKKSVLAKVIVDDKTYDGTKKTMVHAYIQEGDLIAGDYIEIQQVSGLFNDSNAGEKKEVRINSGGAVITGDGLNNYDIEFPKTSSATIKPKPLLEEMFILDGFGDDFNSYVFSDKSVYPNVSGMDKDTPLILNQDFITEGDVSGTDADAYVMSVTGIGNYKGNVELPWEIVLDEMKAEVSGYSGEYDGQEHGISIEVSKTVSNAKIYYGLSEESCDSETALTFKDAGTYVVYYRIEAENYESLLGFEFVIIKPKKVTVTALARQKNEGEKDPRFKYKVSGIAEGEILNGIRISRSKGEDAGEYEIIVYYDAIDDPNPNYEVTFVDAVFKIKPVAKKEKQPIKVPKLGDMDDRIVYYMMLVAGLAAFLAAEKRRREDSD